MIKSLATGNLFPSDLEREGIMSRKVNFRKNTKNQDKKHGSEEKIRTSSILKHSKYGSGGIVKTKSLEAMMPQAERHVRQEQSCENHNINMAIKADYLKHVENLKNNPTKKFQDSTFPPIDSSLFNLQDDFFRAKIDGSAIKWKRISELFDGRIFALSSPSTSSWGVRGASDICPQYLIRGLNTICTNRMVMRNLFESQQANPQGIYFVKIFHNSVWKYEIIDDYIPVVEKQKGRSISYRPLLTLGEVSRNLRDPVEIWMYLIEKAYAKYYGSYQKIIESGNVFDFLCEMTGLDYSYYNTANAGINWKQMFKEPELIALGELPNKSFQTIMPVKGFSQRISFFSHQKRIQKNTIWPADVGKFFTGIFTWGERHYGYWGHCGVQLNPEERVAVRAFSINKTTHCCISIYQKDRRFFPEQIGYSYSWVRAIIVEKQFNGGYRWIDGDYSDLKSIKLENILQAGEYLILLIPEQNVRGQHPELSIVLKTQRPVRLQKQNYEEGTVEEACADLAQRFGRLNQLNHFICSYNCVHEHMGFIIENINNEKRKEAIKIKRSIVNLEANVPIEPWNLQFCARQLEIQINPLRHYTVVLMMKGGVDFNFFSNFSFKARS